jgi:hypothetical protein
LSKGAGFRIIYAVCIDAFNMNQLEGGKA